MPGLTRSVRPLTDADADTYLRLGWEAFGMPRDPATASAAPAYRSGMRPWGLFEGGQLRARAVDREYDAWFGGTPVPTCGVAGVAVAPEARGTGMLRPLLTALLVGARKRGAAISTLFATAPGIYRTCGFEVVAQFDTVELSTAALAAVPAAGMLRTRRASAADFEAVRAVYDGWAAAQNGPLTRGGPSFTATAEEFVASYTGVSLAVGEDDRVRGYASWHRGTGYGPSTALDVADLLGDEAALRTLLRMIGSFASVAPTIRLATGGVDQVRYLLPGNDWPVTRAEPYMLRLLDPAAAFGLRHWPALDAEVVFGLADGLFPDLDGGWRLKVHDGRAACERTDAEPGPWFTDRGLALSYAGAQGCANLRAAGMLSGDDRHDGVWDALLGGRQWGVVEVLER